MHRLFRLAAGTSVVITLAIVVSLAGQGLRFLGSVELGKLWELGWFPRRGLYDLRTIVAGTLIVTGVAIVVAAPLGLGSAIFMAEYASPRWRRWLKPALEVLAGIPSVVLGFFALVWITPNLVNRLVGPRPFSMAAAGIGVGILTTPLIASVAEDGMRAVPMALREASFGLGARKLSTVVRVVLPAAASGIVASLVLGISRAIGETMVVFMAAGAFGGSLLQLNPFEPGQTMTAAMAALATGSDQVAGEGLAFQSLYFVGLALFGMTLVLNVAGTRFVRRVREQY